MNEFGDRLRAAAASHEERTGDARAPQRLRTSIARARRLRIGGSAGVAVVALAAVGAAGVGFTGIGSAPEPSPTASVDLSIDDGATRIATIPFPEVHEFDAYMAPFVTYCGQPVPEAGADESGFSAVWDVPAQIEIDELWGTTSGAVQASVELTYTGDAPLPVFVDGPFTLYIQDGLVVGAGPSDQAAIVRTFEQGGQSTYRWASTGGAAGCDGDSASGFGPLEPGEYEVVLVTRLHNDEATAAMHSLRMDGYSLPLRSEVPALREGGYECGDEYGWTGTTVLTCQPNALPGVEIDEEAGLVTVPYNSSYYEVDVDLAYISPAIDVTVTPNDEDQSSYPGSEIPAYESGTVPACGDVYSDVYSGSVFGPWEGMSGSLKDVAEGDVLEPELWRTQWGWTTATVTIPIDPRVWILESRDIEWDNGEDDPGYQVTYQVQEVVGWMETASSSDDDTLEIIRYDGPEPWPLTVTEVEWCDGRGSSDDTLTNQFAMVASPGTVALDNGQQEEIGALILYP